MSDVETRTRMGYPGFGEMIGGSAVMQALFRTIEAVGSRRPSTVLIEGESGTGREHAARELHGASSHASGAFVTIDCAGGEPQGLDAVLDAMVAGRGLEAAEHATVYLDGVASLADAMQERLVAAMCSQARRRQELSGSPGIWLIASSSEGVVLESGHSRMHASLQDELKQVRLRIPPVRSRGTDAELLFRYFLDQQARRRGRRVHQISAEVCRRVDEYDWPGNVREVREVAAQCLVASRGERIDARHLPTQIRDMASPTRGAVASTPPHVKYLLPREGVVLDQVERDLVMQALERTAGNQSRAARLLGINRFALRTRMRRHGMLGTDEQNES